MNFKFLVLLVICTMASNKAISQSTLSPQVESFSLDAPQLDTIKKMWIYLPKSYKKSGKRFPVIYMHDAQNLFDREKSFAGEWRVDETLDSLSAESIIVGIEHGGDKRIGELTPFPNEKYGGGKGSDYVHFLTKTLKPYVDSTYRTIPDKKNTAILGSSLGGLISFYAALENPDIFGKVGVYSPSFWFSNEIFEYVEKAELDKNMRFYFLAGTKESEYMVPDLEKMIVLLRKKGLKNYHLQLVEGGEHNEHLWARSFPETYLWLIKN